MNVARILTFLLAAWIVSGCERQMRNMYDQPKLDPLSPSPIWPDGRSARALDPRTVAYSAGSIADTSSGRLQVTSTSIPAVPPVTRTLLERGRERFEIYCTPCHGEAGYGDGMIVHRGFPAPPSYHTERLRNAPDQHFYDVITNGYGVMYSYADRVAPEDRRAIIAYIRALQLSQHAMLDDVPLPARQRLQETGR